MKLKILKMYAELNSEINILHSRDWVPGCGKSIFTDGIHHWISILRPCWSVGTINEGDVTMPIPSRVHVFTIPELQWAILGDNGNMTNRCLLSWVPCVHYVDRTIRKYPFLNCLTKPCHFWMLEICLFNTIVVWHIHRFWIRNPCY